MRPGIVLLIFGLVLAVVGLDVWQYGADLRMSISGLFGRESFEGNTAVTAGISVIVIGGSIAIAGLVTLIVQRKPHRNTDSV